jgi:hypothetical protein
MGKSNKDGNYFNGYDVYASNGKDKEDLDEQSYSSDYSTMIGLVIGALAVYCLYKTVACNKKRR